MLSREQATRGKYIDIDAIKRNVDAGPYDAVLVVSPENLPYYTGFYNFDLRGIPERIHVVVWPRGGEPAWVVTERRAAHLLEAETYLTDVQTYLGEEVADSMNVVARVLQERVFLPARVCYEVHRFMPR